MTTASWTAPWRIRLLPWFLLCTWVACGGTSPTPEPDGDSICGDGVLQSSETCDDANTTAGDGCGARCVVELGWVCPTAGSACRAAGCGDGVRAGDEGCDDGNASALDGCSAACLVEAGYTCETVGAPCVRTVCGDSLIEGTEQCDDGNLNLGDGCSADCTREPRCANGTCESSCGDGIILPNDTSEECDDGNTRANDGCSPTCRLETGFTCQSIEENPPAEVSIPVVYRDFRGNDLAGGHVDFENGNGAETGIVGALYTATLSDDGKPVYAKEGVASTTTHGRATFDQWYRNVAGVNKTVVDALTLVRKTGGTYEFNNAAFFPLDGRGWAASGEESARNGSDGAPHNFSFTSEVRYWFEYKGTEVLSFRGDDDVWVYINRRLALDLGGVHGAQSASLTLSSRATQLGLQVGGIYEAAVFQAERHTSASSYQLTLTNFLPRHTECHANCGNGVVDPGEQCDDKVNTGAYGKCGRGCVLGPRCGDGLVQEDGGEVCDDGNTTSHDGCSATCQVEIY